MMRPRLTALAAVAVVLPLVTGCSSDAKQASTSQASSASAAPSTTAARSGACTPVPAQIEQPDWFPADLPLPKDSFPVADTATGSSALEADSDAESGSVATIHREFVAVKGTVDDFVGFTKTSWVAAGYSLGRGESEPGEAEGGFRKGDFGGSYRIRDVYCDATMTELLITYGKGAVPG